MGLKIKVGEAKFTLLDDKQWYPARLLAVEESVLEWEGKPVPKYEFKFALLHPEDFEGREVNGMVNQPTSGELNERHTLFSWITALRGGVPPVIGDEINFPDEFLGKVVLVQVKNTNKNYQGREMTFQNVSKLAVCADAAAYANRAPDKRATGVPAAPAAAAPAARPAAPAAAPRAAAPAQPAPVAQPPAPQAPPPATNGGKITVDGEEIDIPF